ncbi:peptidyl-tRNA hydrolase [Succinimonas sp.]|uniref:peptidyl-tRNA hydrolase n=1 Tax=Succinimonas sp. TaxID=1936151 RepID=UPI00386CB55D
MGTRGSFIMRKGNAVKEAFIRWDAYPDGIGRDVLTLIKTVDLDRLFEQLMTEKEFFERFPKDKIPGGESQFFSLRLCEDAAGSGEPYVYFQPEWEEEEWFIQDSLMCEYAYELDLNDRLLYYSVGFQKSPQQGNRFGCKKTREGYYPCRLKAIYSFDYIRQHDTYGVLQQMKNAKLEESDVIRRYTQDPEPPAAKPETHAPQKQGVRQLIIARKDLEMSPGKLAAQVSHASMAFISHLLLRGVAEKELKGDTDEVAAYQVTSEIPPEIYDDWFRGIFTKIICEARNRDHLLKAVTMAEELGLREGRDFFLIKDCCLTELEPEEYDENGKGRVLTCIGFRPLKDDMAHAISKKYQLYK